MKTRITLVVGLALGLLSTEKIHAEHKSSYSSIYSPILTAKTRKPDLFSKTRTEYFTKYGQKVGVSEAKKPDLLGKTKTTFMDKYGKTLGTGDTRSSSEMLSINNPLRTTSKQAKRSGPPVKWEWGAIAEHYQRLRPCCFLA